MNRAKASELFNLLEKTLKQFGEENNLTLNLKNRKFDEVGIMGSFEFLQNNGEINGEQVKFNNACRYYGLSEEDYNKEIIIDGVTYKIIGINQNARSMPIIALNVKNGSKYALRTSVVLSALGKN